MHTLGEGWNGDNGINDINFFPQDTKDELSMAGRIIRLSLSLSPRRKPYGHSYKFLLWLMTEHHRREVDAGWDEKKRPIN